VTVRHTAAGSLKVISPCLKAKWEHSRPLFISRETKLDAMVDFPDPGLSFIQRILGAWKFSIHVSISERMFVFPPYTAARNSRFCLLALKWRASL
jgi:hypothetical protein